jgi:hypothetical protein
MANFDFKDINITYNGHPRFNINQLEEDDLIYVVVNKFEMILFTNKGEVLGDPDFGGDLYFYLHSTKVSAEFVRKDLINQISNYIPELQGVDYKLEVTFQQSLETYTDMMFIEFKVKEAEVNAFFA